LLRFSHVLLLLLLLVHSLALLVMCRCCYGLNVQHDDDVLPLPLLLLLLLCHSLALVGDVPEFREGRSRLAALEDRLQRRVEGRLADALQVSNVLLCCSSTLRASTSSFRLLLLRWRTGCSGEWRGAWQTRCR
jgi:hypothetical protein